MTTLENSTTCILVEQEILEEADQLEIHEGNNPSISKRRKSMPATTMMVLLTRMTSRWYQAVEHLHEHVHLHSRVAASRGDQIFARLGSRFTRRTFATS